MWKLTVIIDVINPQLAKITSVKVVVCPFAVRTAQSTTWCKR